MYPYRWSWYLWIKLLTGLYSILQTSHWFNTRSFKWYPMVLQRHLVSRALTCLSKLLFNVHVSQLNSKMETTSNLKIQIFVRLHRYWQHHILMLSESIKPNQTTQKVHFLNNVSTRYLATWWCRISAKSHMTSNTCLPYSTGPAPYCNIYNVQYTCIPYWSNSTMWRVTCCLQRFVYHW